MNLNTKNKLLISFGFGLYQLLINLFFDSYQFLNENNSFKLYILCLFFVFSLSEFISIFFLFKSTKDKAINKILFSISFLFSGLVGGVLLFLFFSSNFNHFFLFIASFIIASFLPTLIFFLYFIFKETQEKFHAFGKVLLKNDLNSLEENEKLFHIENANGKILLEVPIKKIICFEANDNYVVTYFLKNDTETAKSMERISLKKIEEMLNIEEVKFNRVHKSYLINPEYIDEVKGRAQAYKIKLKFFNSLVPVSRSYNINSVSK